MKHPFTALNVAEEFTKRAIGHHGISKSIASDIDKVFTGPFFVR